MPILSHLDEESRCLAIGRITPDLLFASLLTVTGVSIALGPRLFR
jgi:hypothetical protein